METNNIRNIAIIAHVDHGKTTLVDGLLKQSKVFAEHQSEMTQHTIMDSNDLERERGVTILAKNTAIEWDGHKINILDTPGHADFAGEVERVLSMVDGCLLLVDAAEGVLSQTKYVLSLAFRHKLKVIVILNKVDKKDQRAQEVIEEINDLFLELADHEDQLDFPVLYAIGKDGIAGPDVTENPDHSLNITNSQNLQPLFEKIIEYVPAPTGDPEGGFQLQVTTLDSDSHKGLYSIGKVARGKINQNEPIVIIRNEEVVGKSRIEYLFTYKGLHREPITTTTLGDIIAIVGPKDIKIGDTLTDPDHPEALPNLYISEPTLEVEFSVSNSPLVGQDGEFNTSRQIHNRLAKELETNVGLRVSPGSTADSYRVAGRGELHLSILIETMRREGFEFSVSRPQVIFKTIDGRQYEPWELATIEVPEEHSGTVITAMGLRKGTMTNVTNLKNGVRMEFKIATRNLIGARSQLLKATSGMCVFNTQFLEYEPKGPDTSVTRNGAIVAHEPGQATAYSLEKIQQRATTFVGPGEQVYKGMVIGLNSRQEDMVSNVAKGKKLTNTRAAAGDDIVKLAPPVKMTLEESLTFLNNDELLEVTPKNLRIRKRDLNAKR